MSFKYVLSQTFIQDGYDIVQDFLIFDSESEAVEELALAGAGFLNAQRKRRISDKCYESLRNLLSSDEANDTLDFPFLSKSAIGRFYCYLETYTPQESKRNVFVGEIIEVECGLQKVRSKRNGDQQCQENM